jgi:hypothetical protein
MMLRIGLRPLSSVPTAGFTSPSDKMKIFHGGVRSGTTHPSQIGTAKHWPSSRFELEIKKPLAKMCFRYGLVSAF